MSRVGAMVDSCVVSALTVTAFLSGRVDRSKDGSQDASPLRRLVRLTGSAVDGQASMCGALICCDRDG